VVVDEGFTLALHTPLPEPLAVVVPSLNVKVHTPFAVTIPLMVAPLPPLHIPIFEPLMLELAPVFTVTASDPLRAPDEHPEASLNNIILYVVLDTGLTLILKLLPVPVCCEPSLSVTVQVPVAFTVPIIAVLLPLHMAVAPLTILAVGDVPTVTVSVPPRMPVEHPDWSLRELIV
jgi:hypothetical protein